MTTEPARRAYQQFTNALTAWWALPPAQRGRMPQPADFTGADGTDATNGTDDLDEGPASGRAPAPQKPETRKQKPSPKPALNSQLKTNN